MAAKKETQSTVTVVFANQEAALLAQEYVNAETAKKNAAESKNLAIAFCKIIVGGEFTLNDLKEALKETSPELLNVKLTALSVDDFMPEKERAERLTQLEAQTLLCATMGEGKWHVKALSEKLNRPEGTIRVWLGHALKANTVKEVQGQFEKGYKLYTVTPKPAETPKPDSN